MLNNTPKHKTRITSKNKITP